MAQLVSNGFGMQKLALTNLRLALICLHVVLTIPLNYGTKCHPFTQHSGRNAAFFLKVVGEGGILT